MPSLLHDVGAMWLHKNFLQAHERWLLPPNWLQTVNLLTNPTFGNFLGPFENQRKEPDCALIPCRQGIQYPTIVLETGYRVSSVGLENDAMLWHTMLPYSNQPFLWLYVSFDEVYGGVGPPEVDAKGVVLLNLTMIAAESRFWVRHGGHIITGAPSGKMDPEDATAPK
ncbi:hypothetical protein HOY82DRAFT_595309 [Tuber indicum]|nr:hypothetical protein HOY82DRAFT_595309 [Tuber indicum]